jgi:uncharacterized membrane protein YhaH (DUF805 family)
LELLQDRISFRLERETALVEAIVRDLMSFGGRRIGRRAWWMVLVAVALAGLAVGHDPAHRALAVWLATAGLVYTSWQRFQDRDRPGWLALVWPILMAIDGLVIRLGGPLHDGLGPRLIGWSMLFAAAWLITELGFMAGSPEANRYGPVPGRRPQRTEPAEAH